MKTAAELIVNAAIRHFHARVADHLESVTIAGACGSAQHELERHCGWKFWSTAEAAVNRIVISDHSGVSRVEQLRLDRIIGTTCFTETPQFTNQRSARFSYFLLALLVSLRDA